MQIQVTNTQAPSDSRHRRLLALVAVLTFVVLVLTAAEQIYDTNFYSLWEATAILSGDHPYRDFFEWGIPLQAMVSAGAQLLVGYRLIGEFLVQWSFITAGAVISFGLALRATRSVAWSLTTAILALVILAVTPIFHYPKLFFYPLGLWIAWWYVDRPGTRRAVVLGLATAVAFLFRHDHGVYLAALAAMTFGLARLVVPASRSVRAALLDSTVYGISVAMLLAPWAIVVQMNEGLPEYVRSRAQLYREWSASNSPYRALRSMNPVRLLTPKPLPPPMPATVSFEWDESIDDAKRAELEQKYGLRLLQRPNGEGRWRYEVANAYDVHLLDLNEVIKDTQGFEWERLQRARSPLPSYDDAQLWIEQTALLIPLLLLVVMAAEAGRNWYRAEPIPLDTYKVALAAAFLAAINGRLFREPSYVVVVAPVTAALGARLLAGRGGDAHARPTRNPRLARAWNVTRWTLAFGMLLVTSIAAYAYSRNTDIYHPMAAARAMSGAFSELLASPPIDGDLPPDDLLRYDRAAWDSGQGDSHKVLMRYVHDCTRPGDHILVTGSTPYQVGYYVERPIAGGHLFWHHRWRSDPEHEMASLALLQRQSVPFALSTTDPVLEDFKTYPRIRQYLIEHYVELEGSHGFLLIDKRRQPTGTFAAVGFPCFR
jgi:hypothetical protein